VKDVNQFHICVEGLRNIPVLFSVKKNFAGIFMFSFSLKVGVYDTPSHVRLSTFDAFSGMHQFFAGMRTG
jgi:hypothetical protein